MSWLKSSKQHLSLVVLPVLLLMAQGAIQAAALNITTSVSGEGSNYLYDVAIADDSSTNPDYNLISVDFSFPAGTIVGTAIAPAGNGETTDPSGNFVEFTSDNVSGFPLGMTVDGFQFLSSAYFGSFLFTANYLDSTGSMLSTVNGMTSTPTPAVPEPATFGLLAAASLLLCGRLGLRRSN